MEISKTKNNVFAELFNVVILNVIVGAIYGLVLFIVAQQTIDGFTGLSFPIGGMFNGVFGTIMYFVFLRNNVTTKSVINLYFVCFGIGLITACCFGVIGIFVALLSLLVGSIYVYNKNKTSKHSNNAP
jgi:hypothetical protein